MSPRPALIDIVIPYWGDPSLLRAAVDSVLSQTDDAWRLTVIDDCYPDVEAASFLADIADERVSYIRNHTNIGITANFRKSVALATAPFVTIMGFDDLLLPDYVKTISRVATECPEVDMIQPGVTVIDGAGRATLPLVDRVKGWLSPRGKNVSVLGGEALAASLLRGNWLYWPSLAFRTQTIRKYDFRDDLAVIQDLPLLIDIAFDGGTLAFDPTPSFVYRRHQSSASQVALYDGRRFDDERRYYRDATAQARSAGWTRAARSARTRPMSRLHAIADLPRIVGKGNLAAVRAAVAHIFA